MAPMAAVSCENMRARLNRGSAMVMMIRIIAITISNSIREKPRRRRCRFIIQSLPYYVTTRGTLPAWRLLRAGSNLRQRVERKAGHREIFGVVGEQGERVVDRYGRNDDVAETERSHLAGVIAFERASHASGGRRDRKVLEAGQKPLPSPLLPWAACRRKPR